MASPGPGTLVAPGMEPSRSNRFVVVALVLAVVVLGTVVVVAVMFLRGSGTAAPSSGSGLPPTSAPSPFVTVDPSITALPPPGDALPVELSATPADPGVLIDAPTAATVTKTLVPLRMDALRRRDASTIERLEAGDALQVDQSGYQYAIPSPGTERYLGGDALEQHQYPVNFVAEVRWQAPNGRSTVDLLVITRASAADTWKLSLEAQFEWDDAIAFLGATAQVPFVGHLDPATSGVAGTYPAAMAAYWQSWVDHGHPPEDTPFSSSGALLDKGELIVRTRSRIADREIRATHYEAGPNVYAYPLGDHSTMLCGTVHWQSDSTPASGGLLVQPADRSWFGLLLAPGDYTEVRERGLRQSCFVATGRAPGVFGQTGDIFEASGSLAH